MSYRREGDKWIGGKGVVFIGTEIDLLKAYVDQAEQINGLRATIIKLSGQATEDVDFAIDCIGQRLRTAEGVVKACIEVDGMQPVIPHIMEAVHRWQETQGE